MPPLGGGLHPGRLSLARLTGRCAARDHEDRTRRLTNQPRGGAAQEDPANRSPTAGADDDEVDALRQRDEALEGVADDGLADRVDVEAVERPADELLALQAVLAERAIGIRHLGEERDERRDRAQQLQARA